MATSGLNEARYAWLVAKAVERGQPAGYFERHHVVPRSAGGGDTAGNIVCLTAREHFLAHWLLYRIYRTPAAARAFKLMVHDQQRRRGRDYAHAREVMAQSMRGDANVARRPDVRAKLIAKHYSPFAGQKRPEHSRLMREKGLLAGARNPFYGRGAEQAGTRNHMATPVVGLHIYAGVCRWETMTSAAQALGVSLQAVAQAIRRGARTKGWRMERAV